LHDAILACSVKGVRLLPDEAPPAE
jgi:hypothetical protein